MYTTTTAAASCCSLPEVLLLTKFIHEEGESSDEGVIDYLGSSAIDANGNNLMEKLGETDLSFEVSNGTTEESEIDLEDSDEVVDGNNANITPVSKDNGSLEKRLSLIREGLFDLLNIEYPFFSAGELQEIEGMICSLETVSASTSSKAVDGNEEMRLNQDSASGNTIDQDFPKNAYGGSNSKKRGLSINPLLDIDKDYDPDSLPSPTHSTHVEKGFGMGSCWEFKPEWPIHPYEADAFIAVSTYQEKFGPRTLLMFDRLRSTSPSENSTFPMRHIENPAAENTSMVDRPPVPSFASSSTKMDNLRLKRVTSTAAPLNSGSNSDPAGLWLQNSDATAWDNISSSAKRKAVEEWVLDGTATVVNQKRPRTDQLADDSGITSVRPGTGGWFEE